MDCMGDCLGGSHIESFILAQGRLSEGIIDVPVLTGQQLTGPFGMLPA